MRQNKPILHGGDHQCGGADPIPGLCWALQLLQEIQDQQDDATLGGGGTTLLGTGPGVVYELEETTGDWLDSSGSERTATYVPQTGTVRGTDDGVLVDGPDPDAGLSTSMVGYRTDAFFEMGGHTPFSLSVSFTPHAIPDGTFSMGICGNSSDASTGGWGFYLLSENFDPNPDEPGQFGEHVGGKPCFFRVAADGTVQMAYAGAPVIVGVKYEATIVYDGATISGLTHVTGPNVTLATGVAQHTFHIGDVHVAEGFGGNWAPFNGVIGRIAVWNRALTGDEVAEIGGTGSPGMVPTLNSSGRLVYAYPAFEAEY